MIDLEQKRHERERKKAETLANKRAQKTGRGKKRPIPRTSGMNDIGLKSL